MNTNRQFYLDKLKKVEENRKRMEEPETNTTHTPGIGAQITTDTLKCELCPKCGLPGNPIFGPMCASDECYFKNDSAKANN